MKRYAVFIEPTGPLRQAIVSLKEKVERQLPGQAYGFHPPHCTLLVGQYESPDEWRKDLTIAISKTTPFEIQTDGFQIFYDDVLAGGGHTFTFKAKPTAELFALQKKAADVLKEWRTTNSTGKRVALMDREPFRSSQVQFGFPFVGQHWIPHFSIASLKVVKDSPLLGELSSGGAQFSFLLDRVSVWEIEGDHHAKMFELPFAGG